MEFSISNLSYSSALRWVLSIQNNQKNLGNNLTTVELKWLEHLWDYENFFETGVVRAIENLLQSQVRRHNRDIFSINFNMKVYCVFSLESPQRADSNEYIQYTISQY